MIYRPKLLVVELSLVPDLSCTVQAFQAALWQIRKWFSDIWMYSENYSKVSIIFINVIFWNRGGPRIYRKVARFVPLVNIYRTKLHCDKFVNGLNGKMSIVVFICSVKVYIHVVFINNILFADLPWVIRWLQWCNGLTAMSCGLFMMFNINYLNSSWALVLG